MDGTAIQQVPLFASLPAQELTHLAELLQPRQVPAGEVLFNESEVGDRLSIILSGQVEIIKALDTGNEHRLATMGPGEYFGEMSLLYPDRLRSASARTLTSVVLLELTQADFHDLLQRNPPLAFHIMQEMSHRLRSSEELTIATLRTKNLQLSQAYNDLQAAQAQLIEKEKMEHELQMARRIQEKFLPKELPNQPGWQIAVQWVPARAVSGDFYDFIQFPDGRLGLLVGDVSGKSVSAAMVMAITRSVLRAVVSSGLPGSVPGGEPSPGAILAQANNLLCPDMPTMMFVTVLFVVLNPATGEICFANAGHNLPCCLGSGDVHELRATGMPLGLMPDMSYEEKHATLEPGQTLLLYSDGLVEAHNPQGDMFGIPRLKTHLGDLLATGQPLGSATLIPYILSRLTEFTGPTWEQEDDLTLLVLERLMPS